MIHTTFTTIHGIVINVVCILTVMSKVVHGFDSSLTIICLVFSLAFGRERIGFWLLKSPNHRRKLIKSCM